MMNWKHLCVWTDLSAVSLLSAFNNSLVQSLVLPAGANGILGSSSEKSALIRLLSEEARHWVRAGKLSTLPLLDRGRVLSCSSWTRQKNTFLGRVAEGQISKVSLSWECSSLYSVGLCIIFNCASYTDRAKMRNLNYLVWRKLRYTLDGVVAPVRITVLHVCITFDAHAGAGIFHIRTCLRDTHMHSWVCPANSRKTISRPLGA